MIALRPHVANMYDATPAQVAVLVEETRRLALHYRSRLGATAFNVLHASGEDAQQSVRHLHVHLIPRWADDGLDTWPAFPPAEIDRQLEYERMRLTG